MDNKIIPAIIIIIAVILLKIYLPEAYTDNQSLTDVQRLEQLIKSKVQGENITVKAKIIKHLADDLKGSKHQKFIVKAGKHTLLVAHNIDIAQRVPAAVGDVITLKGDYEWNDKGGLIHWTHRDNNNKHEQGWIMFKNKKYH